MKNICNNDKRKEYLSPKTLVFTVNTPTILSGSSAFPDKIELNYDDAVDDSTERVADSKGIDFIE